MSVYVSVTGFRPRGGFRFLVFWGHTLRSLAQARRAPGNLGVTLREVGSVYHTMTVWRDEADMRTYVRSGAHLRAMKSFRSLGSGKTLGFTSEAAPDWDAAYRRWLSEAREV